MCIHLTWEEVLTLMRHLRRIRALSSLLQTPRQNNKELQKFNDRVATDQGELAALLKQRKRQA